MMKNNNTNLKVAITKAQTQLRTTAAQIRYRNMLSELFVGQHKVVAIVEEGQMTNTHFDIVNTLAEKQNKLVLVQQTNEAKSEKYISALNSILSGQSLIASGLEDVDFAIKNSSKAQFFSFNSDDIHQLTTKITVNNYTAVLAIIRAPNTFPANRYNEINAKIREAIANTDYLSLGFVIDNDLNTEFEIDLFTFVKGNKHRFINLVELQTNRERPMCDNHDESYYEDEGKVKCTTPGCDEYDHPSNFFDGRCASCAEIAQPLSPQEQEGAEHNARKWNES